MVKSKKEIRIFGFIACLFLAVSLMIVPTAHALYYQLLVPQYCQVPYDKICWATVSAMIVSFYKGDKIDRKVEIATQLHGSNFNQGGTIVQMRDIIKTYINRKGTVLYDGVPFLYIQQRLAEKRPMAFGITFLQLENQPGHSLCVKGFSSDEGNRVYAIDPADGDAKSWAYNYLVSNSQFSWDSTLIFAK